MSARIRIAIDAMSGDLGPRVAIAAAQKFIATFDDVDLLFVGDERLLPFLLSKKEIFPSDRISFINATQIVTMADDPVMALRHKQDSSMWRAVESVKNNLADACVSSGNTGALLAISKHLLKTFPGIERPAICKLMPTEKNNTYLLDLGANINCSAEQLHQFAIMGNVLALSDVNTSPRVGLLNIGIEAIKGTDIIQAAQKLLQCDSRLHYCGFVEANELFLGNMDVIVCDGFHGNIALKSSEGVARFIAKKLHNTFSRTWLHKGLGLIILPLLNRLQAELDPAMYDGASFLGLQKTVVKSHGNANQKAFMKALIVAREQVIQQIPAQIQQQFLVTST
ncbi:MAG: phosphate acyltransferase PlsX [Pseudomonadota bacterium]